MTEGDKATGRGITHHCRWRTHLRFFLQNLNPFKAHSSQKDDHGQGCEKDNEQRESLDPWLLRKIYPNAKDIFTGYAPPAVLGRQSHRRVGYEYALAPLQNEFGKPRSAWQGLQGAVRQKAAYCSCQSGSKVSKHRDSKLGELIQALNEQRKRFPSDQLPPLVQDVDGYAEAAKCLADIKTVKDAYDKAVGKIIAGMKEWRGNDPVAKLYASVFPADAIVDLPVGDAKARDDLLMEARRRTANRIPGYQDAGKDDEGVGDFLIWKSLLELARARKQDLAFVTGEQKNDWWVRSGGVACLSSI